MRVVVMPADVDCANAVYAHLVRSRIDQDYDVVIDLSSALEASILLELAQRPRTFEGCYTISGGRLASLWDHPVRVSP